MKKIIILLSALVYLASFRSAAQESIPNPIQPPRMVNDFVGFLNPNEAGKLEQKLRVFNNQTSTQIYIVIVKSLNGYDPNDYTVRLAEKWGIGQKGKDNGIVILVKPNTIDSDGEVYIAPGYGLEGAVTDLAAGRILDNEIIPEFKNGNYYKGLDNATNTLISITRGEFTSESYVSSNPPRTRKRTRGSRFYFLIPLFLILSIFGRSRGSKHSSVGRSLPFWLLLGMMGSGHSRGSGFGNFSSGSGGFGGFGGGGGGSFGGGGAGGSW